MTQLMSPREYVPFEIEIPDHWRVLDIGPGAYPLSRADVYMDHDLRILEPLGHNRTYLADIQDGAPAFGDKEFDFVWCSHVLEHVNDPAACARTISRIGKRGIMVVPSAIKESIFNFEERQHQWLILPNPVDGEPPIFVRHNRSYIERLRDELVQQAACFLYRTGSDHDCTAEIHMGEWFRERERDLDIIVHWEDELKIMVIG